MLSIIDKSVINNFSIDNKTSYKMIDVGKKYVSHRRACVCGSIYVGKEVFYLIKNKCVEKGDPLLLAEIAGINAAKNTSNLILLCHQINIENVFLNLVMDDKNYIINVYCIVYAHAKTGVEMEAMCGVSVALLTIYDLTKKFNPFIFIKDIKLLFKDGGENGLVLGSVNNIPIHLRKFFLDTGLFFEGMSVVLITVSDRASFGCYKNISGQVLFDFFSVRKTIILDSIVVPDDKNILRSVLKSIVNKYSPNLILTSGGTGLSDRDITGDVLFSLCDKFVPGIGEMLRSGGSVYSSVSWLSCSIAGIYKKSLIISLPGNPSAVCESLNMLQNILLHAVRVVNKL